MNDQRNSFQQLFYPEVVATLSSLAQLTQQVLVSKTPDLHASVASQLLEHLLQLCEMQRGALLLAPYAHAAPQRTSPSGHTLLRLLARQEIDENELHRLLVSRSDFVNELIQHVSLEEDWFLYQHLIYLPRSLPQEGATGEGPMEMKLIVSPSPARLLLLGRAHSGTAPHHNVLEKGRFVWPLVADAVGTVVLSLLQAERLSELEVETRQQDIQQMEWLKSELLATVSHELRSPLASIKGYTATLLRHEQRISREERHEFLVAIHDASNRLQTVVDRLLEMSQWETDAFQLNYTPINLSHLAREAITAIEDRVATTPSVNALPVSRGNVTFTLSVIESSDELPLIQGDRSRLREVFDHLLENAVLYSPAGGCIEVALRSIEPEQAQQLHHRLTQVHQSHQSVIVCPPAWPMGQPMVEVWIRDQGMGIPQAHLRSIFTRFHRVDTHLTREVNGLGLGLTICRRIIEAHHGIFWVESQVDQGSTFHVLLPVVPEVFP